jgi:hypothetical protein
MNISTEADKASMPKINNRNLSDVAFENIAPTNEEKNKDNPNVRARALLTSLSLLKNNIAERDAKNP